MRNEHIKVGDIVPASIAIECYEKAIEIIESGKPKYWMGARATCLLLPCILWDLKTFFDDAPSGEGWRSRNVPHMFPEWSEEIVMEITDAKYEDRNPIRLRLLKAAIEQAKIRQQHEKTN